MKKGILAVLPLVLLAACSMTPPKPNVALPKTVEVDGKSITLSGEYWVKKNQLTIFANGEPILRGSFPPYTPTLNLNAVYEGVELRSHCYFGSVLQSQGGLVGGISSAIQGSKGKSGDQCEITAGQAVTDTLYF